MKLEGLHHITMITADAQATVDFYADVLGLRLVKKTVNFDQPDAYHLYFGDETGAPGSILTWFEFPGAARGRAGIGMIHTLQLGVGSEAALGFWAARPAAAVRCAASARCASPTPTASRSSSSSPRTATRRCAPSTPRCRPSTRSPGSRAPAPTARSRRSRRASSRRSSASRTTAAASTASTARSATSTGPTTRRRPRGPPGRGHRAPHRLGLPRRGPPRLAARIVDADGYVSEVRDRDYFRSIYFREPRGVLFEIATLSPGFAVDEDPEHLGEALRLPAQHEHLREQLERTLARSPTRARPRVA